MPSAIVATNGSRVSFRAHFHASGNEGLVLTSVVRTKVFVAEKVGGPLFPARAPAEYSKRQELDTTAEPTPPPEDMSGQARPTSPHATGRAPAAPLSWLHTPTPGCGSQ